jgi:hypothetical protein
MKQCLLGTFSLPFTGTKSSLIGFLDWKSAFEFIEDFADSIS